MVNPELEKYINAARERKVSDEVIKSELIKSGWSESDVLEALTSKPSTGIDVPPPPVPRFGMWVAFQYILLFISLYVTATAVSSILHYAVDDFIRDPLDKTGYDRYSGFAGFDYFSLLFGDQLLILLAALIVAFPIFGALFLIVKKEAIAKPAIRGLKTRKILIYITLVITFLILVGHLIGTIYSFLSGTVTTRILAHLVVTFAITGSIFAYLLREVWEDRKSQ